MRPVSIFISYSQKDEDFRDELVKHLRVLERTGIVTSWHDRRILPGSDWSSEIDQHIEQADILLCLVSANFIDSDYCWEKEMKRALARYHAQQAVVIPILIKPVAWGHTPLAAIQGLPIGLLPVSSWPNRDDAWRSIVEAIMEVSQGIYGARRRALESLEAASTNPNIVPPELAEALEFLRYANFLPAEGGSQQVNLNDLTLLRVHAPALAKDLEYYRRAFAQLSTWANASVDLIKRSFEDVKIASLPFAVSTTILAERNRRLLGVRLLEANVLLAFEDARVNGSPGLKSLLEPARYGFDRTLPALNDIITKEMDEYSWALEASEVSVTTLKEVIAAIAKAIGCPLDGE